MKRIFYSCRCCKYSASSGPGTGSAEKEQKPGKRREGTVIKILERGTTEVVGTFQREGDYGFVLCDNQKISRDVYISPKILMESEMEKR